MKIPSAGNKKENFYIKMPEWKKVLNEKAYTVYLFTYNMCIRIYTFLHSLIRTVLYRKQVLESWALQQYRIKFE